MLKLKLQYFGHLMRRANSLERTLMLGKIEGRRRKGWQRMRWLDVITHQWTCVWANSMRQWRTGKSGICIPGGCRAGHNLGTEQQTAQLRGTKFIDIIVQLSSSSVSKCFTFLDWNSEFPWLPLHLPKYFLTLWIWQFSVLCISGTKLYFYLMYTGMHF